MTTATTTYGQQIHRSHYNPERSVVEITRAPIGNVVLRVGRETSPDAETWQQSEHVVLLPDEARAFAADILAQLQRGH
jgi:hypothetical protein